MWNVCVSSSGNLVGSHKAVCYTIIVTLSIQRYDVEAEYERTGERQVFFKNEYFQNKAPYLEKIKMTFIVYLGSWLQSRLYLGICRGARDDLISESNHTTLSLRILMPLLHHAK